MTSRSHRDAGHGRHAEAELLEAYVDGSLGPVAALSLEAHMLSCERCRSATAPLASAAALGAVWDGVLDAIDAPQPSFVERCLQRIGVPAHLARLLVATPSLSASWLAGTGAVLGFAVLGAHLSGDARSVALFLLLAPVLPLAGVAASYGTFLDLTSEVSVAAPMDGFRLLLLRALTIVAVAVALTGAAAAALPATTTLAMAWLLPALALTSATLALGRLVPLTWAAGGLATAWLLVAVVTANPFAGGIRLGVLGGVGQTASAAVLLGCAAALARSARSAPGR